MQKEIVDYLKGFINIDCSCFNKVFSIKEA